MNFQQWLEKHWIFVFVKGEQTELREDGTSTWITPCFDLAQPKVSELKKCDSTFRQVLSNSLTPWITPPWITSWIRYSAFLPTTLKKKVVLMCSYFSIPSTILMRSYFEKYRHAKTKMIKMDSLQVFQINRASYFRKQHRYWGMLSSSVGWIELSNYTSFLYSSYWGVKLMRMHLFETNAGHPRWVINMIHNVHRAIIDCTKVLKRWVTDSANKTALISTIW